MGNELVAEVKIQGRTPLMWNHFNSNVPQKDSNVDDPDEWKRTVLKTDENQLYLDSYSILDCIRQGVKSAKSRKLRNVPFVVLDKRILIDRYLPDEITDDDSKEVYLDVRSAKNPITKKRRMKYRVCASPGWSATFRIAWNKNIINQEQIEEAIYKGGFFEGIGDGRAIGFGRFYLLEFNVEERVNENIS